MADDELIAAADMPKRYGNSESYWNKGRVAGTGPDFIKLGRKVYYARSAVDAWLERQTRTSTSDSGGVQADAA